MHTETFRLKNLSDLKNFSHGSKESNILIQIFCVGDIEELEKLGKFFYKCYPNAIIVGVTAASTIDSSEVLEDTSIVSISRLKKGKFFSSYAEGESKEVGRKIGEKLKNYSQNHRQRFILLLSDGTETDGDALLEGVSQTFPKVPIVGGMASIRDMHKPTAVFFKNKIIKKGAVGILIEGEFSFKTSYLFDWEEIGRENLVTHSEANRVFTINGIPAVEFYENYLGKEVAEKLPEIGCEYPLVFKKNGVKIARACIKKYPDGSLGFAGRIPTGQNVRIASGSLRGFSVKENVIKKLLDIAENSETIFIYSCIARKNFLGCLIKKELELFSFTKNVGFFTHGEFFYSEEPMLLNETLTVVGINESGIKNKTRYITKDKFYQKEKDRCYSLVIPLTNLLHRTSVECDLITESFSQSNVAFMLLRKRKDKWYCSFASQSLDKIVGFDSLKVRTKQITKEEIINSLIEPSDRKKVLEVMKSISEGKKKEATLDYRVNIRGKQKWIRSFIKVIKKRTEELMIHTFQDITSEKKLEHERRKNYHLAIHDPLTGLYNRLYFFSKLPRILEIHREQNKFGGILFIDIDKFKRINDTFGHKVGDEILKSVAQKIKNSIRKNDLAIRFAGDEFIVLLPLLSKNKEEALELTKQTAEKIIEAVKEINLSTPLKLSIGVSIGVTILSGNSNPEEVLEKADKFMYEAKSLGGNRFFFKEGL